ncbi:MAG: type II secretion system F family protein [Rhodospirillales bacterium]|nr:type II secretion system F family protein [Rhodospirillales bacterium]
MSADPFALMGVAAEDVFIGMAAVAASATVLAIWSALLTRDPVSGRMQRIRQRQNELKAGYQTTKRNQHRNVAALGFMQQVVRRLNLAKSKAAGGIVELLSRAGWRSKDALIVFMFMKLCMPFVFGGAAFLFIQGLGIMDLPPTTQNVLPLGFVILGFYAPEIFVKNAIAKREKLLQKGLPDALDLLVICAEAGLSLDAALTRVSKEMARATPEIAEEFGLTAVELGFLPDRRQALDNLTKRCHLPSIRGVVNTLQQTERYGTPLAQSLRVLSAEYRDERMLKAEEKAAKLPAVLTVPLIIFILPTLMIVLIGPGILRIIDAFSNM